jgi:hypothetical protein
MEVRELRRAETKMSPMSSWMVSPAGMLAVEVTLSDRPPDQHPLDLRRVLEDAEDLGAPHAQ